MSRPWKSELHLDLRRRACSGWLRRGLFARGPRERVHAEGRAASSLPGVVAQLRALEAEGGRRWSSDAARLTIADECAYHALLPATQPWAQRLEHARAHFAAALGAQDLAVRVTLLPGGRHWLAVAVEQAQLATWHDALQADGLHLACVRPALVEDLRRIANRVPAGDGVLALLRDEGAVLLHLVRGVPCALAWERFDSSDADLLARRLKAFARGAGVAGPVAVAVPDEWAAAALSERARAHQWTLLPLRTGPVAPGASA